MARGKKWVPEQGTIDMSINQEHYVVQANDLIGGKQSLGLNAAKLVRAAIMQIKPDDKELHPYHITVNNLAKLLCIAPGNLYRDIESITDNIIKNPVYIKQYEGHRVRWVKIPWVKFCQYDSDSGVAIQLNDLLKPYLIALRTHYAQYYFENILAMKSVYAIRVFEMIQAKLMVQVLPRGGVDVVMPVQEIRDACGLDDAEKPKYASFSNFRARVLDVAVKEINNKTFYTLSYSYGKSGRAVTSIRFHIKRFL